MLLTILKIVAGLAFLGILAAVLVAVSSGLVSAFGALKRKKEGGRRSGPG